jgi:hypothetical protein
MKRLHCENPNNPNCIAAGISGGVFVNHLWPVVAGGGVMKDEALKLALEELENCADLLKVFEAPIDSCVGATMLQAEAAITAIKQALALDKKADNARELGLDYEPADGTQVSKVWWDGEKLMAKPIPLEDIYQPVQESVAKYIGECSEGSLVQLYEDVKKGTEFYTTPPAQPAVPDALTSADMPEHIEYVAGWNDCRAEMLKGMK